jgi:hypothetical protein
VYRAHDRRTGLELALKLVLLGPGSEGAAERLRREGTIMRRVTSRRVARVLDAGEDETAAWLVSELVEGGPLTIATLGRGLLPHEVLRVARALLEGLAAVHRAGVVHADVKPRNVLVPLADNPLDGVKLVDFGVARLPSDAPTAAVSSAGYIAPEVLAGGVPSAASDVYAAGLVLFELLDVGPLFVASDSRVQIRARMASDPVLAGRVPEPLSDVLLRMLARDPRARFANAVEAYDAVVDLDTAPVSIVDPQRASLPPSSRNASMSTRPPSEVRPRTFAARLTTLPSDGVIALRETLRHLDLPMLDALARRERGHVIGRVARAVALALRLELDAAALILEPLAAQSDVARAIGTTLLAPRARRITRARVDLDREDAWVETIDPELAAMLVSLAVALGAPDGRDVSRTTRALARASSLEATRTTVQMAHVAARLRAGEIDRGDFGSVEPAPPFHVVVRAMLLGLVHLDQAIRELEQAERIAAETGTTLLDAASATLLGETLLGRSPRDERALAALDRAGTLLAHGDAPSLEREAAHQRGLALLAVGRHLDAIASFRAAREAASAERMLDLEIPSAALQAMTELALGDARAAYESVAVLGDARLASASASSSVVAWAARALTSSFGQDREAAESALRSGEQRLAEVADPALHALLAVVGVALGVRTDAPDATWVDGLIAAFGHDPDGAAKIERLRALRRGAISDPHAGRMEKRDRV